MFKSNVVAFYKNQSGVAAALGIKPGSVSQWGNIIPEKQAFRLEKLTNGALKYDPDLYAK